MEQTVSQETLSSLIARIERLESKGTFSQYSGWTNYETWACSLWLDNDAKKYASMMKRAEQELVNFGGDKEAAAYTFGQSLEQDIYKEAGYTLDRNLIGDLLRSAIVSINFHEIAEVWMEGVELPTKPEPKPQTEVKAKGSKFTLTASADVLDILSRAKLDDSGLTLPDEQLERSRYDTVDQFLKVAGVKWHKGLKRHIFANATARDKIKRLLEEGELLNEKKLFQAFYTPDEIAAELVSLAGITEGMTCLEPSAGAGAIAQAMSEAGAGVECVEMNPEAAQSLREMGYSPQEADFLSLAAEPRFDRVLMNPPFTADQDIKHVRHAFDFLKPGGKLLAIMSPGFQVGDRGIRAEFRTFLVDHGRLVKVLEEGTFKEFGTMVKTVIVELTKTANAPSEPTLFNLGN